jgi:hypothetical protein
MEVEKRPSSAGDVLYLIDELMAHKELLPSVQSEGA